MSSVIGLQETDASIRDDIEKLKASIREQKSLTYINNDSVTKRLGDLESKLSQLTTVVDALIRENHDLKGIVTNQRFIIQPVNPYQGPQQGPQQGQQQSQQGQQQQQQNHTHSRQQSQSHQVNSHQQFQTQPLLTTAASQQNSLGISLTDATFNPAPNPGSANNHSSDSQNRSQQSSNQLGTSSSSVLDTASLNDSSTNNGILRFINNQYVDDTDTNLQTSSSSSHGHNSSNSRIDFVFMDPASGRGRGLRGGISQTHIQVAPNTLTSPLDSNNHLNASSNDVNHMTDKLSDSHSHDAENYDLMIHNNFDKVEDIYYEYHNSLKPQVERVQKAYKIKKIRKFQKIKALAVRIDRYRDVKHCSLRQSFDFFENLRIGDDNKKRSIAWLYNSLPDVLKKIGMEDQLKKHVT